MRYLSFLIFFSMISGLSSCQPSTVGNTISLRFINEYIIPNDLNFNNTIVGGLSGIDYDSDNNVYYLVSDDRSAINAARFYKVKIRLTDRGIDSVTFLEVNHMLQPNGMPYPSNKQDNLHSPDPESMRYNRVTKQLVWTSEGERSLNSQPTINIISTTGKFVDSIPLPSILRVHSEEKGSRLNGSLESISFADDFKTLFITNEEPLYEDGPRADAVKTNSWCRIFQFDTNSKKNTRQFAYHLEPVAHPANPLDGFKVNGVSEILSLGKDRLLTIERSFSTGRVACVIRIFEVDMSKAANIISVESLAKETPTHPVEKKLLFNMSDLDIYIDNIEGVTFGPKLPNGNRTLIFVSDNNFRSIEKTQLLLFEVIEK